jgi:hypothetical protein
MFWHLEFDEPITLAKSTVVLRTLRDAGEYCLALPKDESDQPQWQLAASCLLTASEKGRGFVMMARIAMMRALQQHEPEPKQTGRRKLTKQYRIVS